MQLRHSSNLQLHISKIMYYYKVAEGICTSIIIMQEQSVEVSLRGFIESRNPCIFFQFLFIGLPIPVQYTSSICNFINWEVIQFDTTCTITEPRWKSSQRRPELCPWSVNNESGWKLESLEIDMNTRAGSICKQSSLLEYLHV